MPDPRTEQAIKLGAEISALRAREVRLEEELRAVRRHRQAREDELEQIMKPRLLLPPRASDSYEQGKRDAMAHFRIAPEAMEQMKAIAVEAVETKKRRDDSITDQVREHFKRNQEVSFSPKEVCRAIGALDSTSSAAVRQALRRLMDGSFLVYEDGGYQFNPNHPERRKSWTTHEDR